MSTQEKNHAREQAKAQLESIQEMVRDLNADNDEVREDAWERILDDPLEVTWRSDWTPGPMSEEKPVEYKILLCTGGPAVRITGDINGWQEPESAKLEYQDWFTPWTNYALDDEEEESLLTYARCFYFGE